VRSRSEPARVRRVPLALVPWLTYLGVTLLAPALDGAGRQQGFREHAAVTLGVSAIVSWPWLRMNRQRARPRLLTAHGGDRAGNRPPVVQRNERSDSG
jgi:hypothetical protein